MSLRISFFRAGLTAFAPTTYFELESLFNLISVGEQALKAEEMEWIEAELVRIKQAGLNSLEKAIENAHEYRLDIMARPANLTEFVAWRQDYSSAFEAEYPMSRIDHYYFLFGFKLAELICNVELLECYLPLLKTAEKHEQVLKRSTKSLKDIQFVLFKLMAPTALLSGEHRHHYFSVYYKEISKGFEGLANYDIEQLNPAEINAFKNRIEEFGLLMHTGLNKCLSLLEELNI